MNQSKWLILIIPFIAALNTYAAGKESDPVIINGVLDQLERRSTEGKDFNVLEAQGWIGKDFNKLRVKVESEFTDDNTESVEVQLVYSRAVTPFWDAQMGYRRDFYPKPENDFLVFGFIGLAPYLFEVDAQLFVGESGQYGTRLEAEYELVLTRNQKWVLVPEIEINAYAENDERAGIGSGLSDLEIGLRLNYFINRHIAPYVGINWENNFGNTADFARAEGEDTNDIQYVIGLRGWF